MSDTRVHPERLAYTVAEVAALTGLTASQVRGLIRSKKLRARATGKAYIVPVEALTEFLAGADEPMASAS